MMPKLIILFIVLKVVVGLDDYYWRDYSEIIPYDAFPVGVDNNRDNTYVGQVFLKDVGTLPTTIYSDKRDIWVPFDSGRKAGNFIQLLCSQNQQLFNWIPTNKTNIQIDSIGHHLVRGGLQDDDWVNIGRIQYQGDTVVGKVMSSLVGNAQLYFTYNTREIKVDNYEVLAFDSDSRYKSRLTSRLPTAYNRTQSIKTIVF